MSKIHILKNNNGRYQAILHFAVPVGNNSAGVTWKDCIVNSGRNKTDMTEGVGAGQIPNAEKVNIIAGDMIEISMSLLVESGGTSGAVLIAAITEMADTHINTGKNRLQKEYKYYGYTQET